MFKAIALNDEAMAEIVGQHKEVRLREVFARAASGLRDGIPETDVQFDLVAAFVLLKLGDAAFDCRFIDALRDGNQADSRAGFQVLAGPLLL